MLKILENSGIRRQQFLGVVDGAMIRGGPLLVFGRGLVPRLLDPLPGNSGTWASLLQAKLLTNCELLVICSKLVLRIIIIRLLSASRMLSLTLQLVLYVVVNVVKEPLGVTGLAALVSLQFVPTVTV